MKYGLIQFEIKPSTSFGSNLEIILCNENIIFPINTYEEVVKHKEENNNGINVEFRQNKNGQLELV